VSIRTRVACPWYATTAVVTFTIRIRVSLLPFCFLAVVLEPVSLNLRP
jgi:hypothetical protein